MRETAMAAAPVRSAAVEPAPSPVEGLTPIFERDTPVREEYSAPVREQPREEARAYAPPKPAPAPVTRSDPREELSSAGLVMVETDRNKAPIAPLEQEPAVPLGRPRRNRSEPQPAAEGALVQVETRSK